MGIFSAFYSPWSFLVIALAIIHFIRRRPDTYWLFIILFLGPLGATIYLLVEALPDVGLLRQSFKVFPRRRRIHELEAAVLDNPSAGNYEELADLYMSRPEFLESAGLLRQSHFVADRFARSVLPARRLRSGIGGFSGCRFGSGARGGDRSRATISTAPKDCWRTPTRIPDNRRRRRTCSGK